MNIHLNMLISNLKSVHSTGYGIGTVFPFALNELFFMFKIIKNILVYDSFRIELRTD